MDESTRKVAEALKKAIQAEIEGQHFYRMAASQCTDPKGREVFLQLAEDEVVHERFLRAHYQSLLEHGVPDGSVKLARATAYEGSSPIFSPALKSRIKDAHFEMTALAVGIQLELGAVDFYKQASQLASDTALSDTLLELSEWEAGHYQALLRQQEELKEDYWSASGFTPF